MTERREPALTAIVLTHNEEKNLEACLAPLAECAAEIVVVDSGSNDGTLEIAKRLGARIVAHPFETHARQWNWALVHTAALRFLQPRRREDLLSSALGHSLRKKQK